MLIEDKLERLLESSDDNSVIEISSIKTVDHGISVIADLNETAIEYIEKGMYEDAGETLLQAYGAIPRIEKLHQEESKGKATKLDYSYFCTIYYNIACVYQKLSLLKDCRLFLDKCLT